MKFDDWSNHINALDKLKNRLSRCFSGAQREFLPPLLPWKVAKTTIALVREKYLRVYQVPHLYLALWIAGLYAYFVHNPLFLFVSSLPFFGLLWTRDRYHESFAQWKTSSKNVDGFGVPYMQLLARGFLEHASRNFSEKDKGAAPLTKDNLASVIKLEKAGHDVLEINYGSSDIMRRVLQTSVVATITFIVAEQGKAHQLLDKVSQSGHWPLMVAYFALCAFGLYYAAYIGEAASKMPRRRFLMVLNMAHEAWPKGLESLEPLPTPLAIDTAKVGPGKGEPPPEAALI